MSKSAAAVNRYNQKNYDVIAVRVPKEMAQQFKATCQEKGISQAQIVKQAIQDFLDKQ